MKKFLILFCTLCLLGCEKEASKTTGSVKTITPNVDSKTVKVAKEGGACGGPNKTKCAAKLECVYAEYSENAVGKCIDPVVDKTVECPQSQSPVCGLKNKRKNGYLNDCEAKRHGAKIMDKGFCKPDPSVVHNCKAAARGIGTCDIFFKGYEYNGKKCVEQGIFGCDTEIPFNSMEDCMKICEK